MAECENDVPCGEQFNCCDCGGNGCGCGGCFSCNACDKCMEEEED